MYSSSSRRLTVIVLGILTVALLGLVIVIGLRVEIAARILPVAPTVRVTA